MRRYPHLPLPLVLALRAHFGRYRALSLVTLLAIASSVTLATGLEMSSRSVESELDRTARAVAGAAEIEIAGGSIGVPEELVDEVAAVPGVRVAAPFVQETFRVDREEAEGTALHVLGVDLLADPSIRTYSGEANVEDPLRLVAASNAAIVSQPLAQRLGLRQGDSLPIRSGRTSYQIVVRGILKPEGLAQAYGGQVAVMDVYGLQAMVGRQGWLDRIDVVVQEGANVDTVMEQIRARVEGRATVRRSAARDNWVESALLAVRVVVSALMIIAILVASLVSYSALSLFVDRRIPEIALLRAAGLEPRRVRRFLYLDAALLGLIGAALGILAGWLLSGRLLTALSWISGFLQGVEIQEIEIHPSTVATALFVGGVVSFAGVLIPARRAARLSPIEVLSANADDEIVKPSHRWADVLMGAGLVLSGVVASLPSAPPMVRVAAILVMGLGGLSLLARVGLQSALRYAGAFLNRVRPGVGRLAGASFVARPAQTTVAVICVAGVVAGITISLSLARSTARTLDAWMEDQFRGGVFVTAGQVAAVRPEEEISRETLQLIREMPGVVGVFDHVGEKILYKGEEVLLAAGSMDVLARFGRLPVTRGDPRTVAEAVAQGGIAVSDGFAHHFGVREGDVLVLDTPRGARQFRVAGLIRDFAGPAGSLNIDISVFDELWSRRGSRDLVFWTSGDPEPVIEAIRRKVGEGQALFFVYGADFARFASGLLSRFERILASVSLMTALLGGIAVWNLMLSTVTARTREFALLLATGATRGQIRWLTIVDGLLLGLAGGVAGVAVGIAAGYPVVSGVMGDALGWSLDFNVRASDLALLMGGLLASSFVASLYPAWVAARVPMREASGAE